MALQLWQRRLSQGKYGSVGFSTFNHLTKGKIDGGAKRASVMGPCIQAVNLTLVKKGQAEIDVFYRTTEILKKFPADLVFLRDVLLAPFDTEFSRINFHFANLTLHPMYWITAVPMMKDPIATMEMIKARDPHFYKWLIKWTARYLCDEYGRGIDKFSQACRVRDMALELIPKKKKLQKYLRKNHPGLRT